MVWHFYYITEFDPGKFTFNNPAKRPDCALKSDFSPQSGTCNIFAILILFRHLIEVVYLGLLVTDPKNAMIMIKKIVRSYIMLK